MRHIVNCVGNFKWLKYRYSTRSQMSVVKQIIEGDRLFLRAESQAKDFSLFPESAKESMKILGTLSQEKIAAETEILDRLTIDA